MAIRTITSGATTLGTITADDDIIFEGGSAAVITSLDHSALTGIDTVEVGPTFNGQIGSASAPFIAQVEEEFFYGASGGSCYFNSTDAGGAAATAKLLMPIGTGGSFYFVSAGTITKAEISGGQFVVATACVVTNLYVTNSAIVRVYDDTSTDPTLVQNHGGTIYLDRGATTLTHIGGQTWVKGTASNNITTLNVHGPGVHLEDVGTITKVNAWGGVPCTRNITKAVTITDCDINAALPTDQVETFLNNPRITFTNPVVKYLGR